MRVKELDYAALRRLIGQWRQISPNYYGDFYPLTSWTRDDSLWMAWQFDRPEAAQGMVQAFRRHNSPYESARFSLRGLDPGARYVVTDLDSGQKQTLSGSELLGNGISVAIRTRPGAAVMTYEKTE